MVGRVLLLLLVLVSGGCALSGTPRFEHSMPRVLLLAPVRNSTPGSSAGEQLAAWSAVMLGEAGYYVLPPALTDQVLARYGYGRQQQVRTIPPQRLARIFGAEGVVWLQVEGTGISHRVAGARAGVHAVAEIVDLRSGRSRWKGRGDSDGRTLSTLLPEPVQMVVSGELRMRAAESAAGQAALQLWEGSTPLPPGPY